MRKVSRNSLIVQQNDLIRAKSNLTAAEIHLIAIAIAHLEEGTLGFVEHRISASLIASLCQSKLKDVSARLEELAIGLLRKPLKINLPGGDWIAGNWFSTIKYKADERVLICEFSPSLMPYLLQIKRNFTKYQLRNILALNESNHIQLYELMKRYQDLGQLNISIEELRVIMGFKKEHQSYKYFKRDVLIPARNKINQTTDIWIDFEQVRESRKITRLIFKIHAGLTDIEDFKRFVTVNYPDCRLADINNEPIAVTKGGKLYNYDYPQRNLSAAQMDAVWEAMFENKQKMTIFQ